MGLRFVEILLDHLRLHFERQPEEDVDVLEAREASDDEFEAKHQALTTIYRTAQKAGGQSAAMVRPGVAATECARAEYQPLIHGSMVENGAKLSHHWTK